MIKTITNRQLPTLDVWEIRAGMVIPEGLILEVRSPGPTADWWFDTVVATVHGTAGDKINVFCRVDDITLEAARAAFAEARKGR